MDNNYNELYEKLARLQWLLQRHHMQSHSEHGPFADPTRGQGRVLAMLKMQPEITTKDLSYLLGIRQQSLNELLNKLEKAGYVTRTPSEADRRVMLVRLTEKGKTEQQADVSYSGIFDCLSPEEEVAFGDYLDRIIAALESQVGSDVDEEEMDKWMRAARSRMGNETFDRMMSMRGGPHPHRHGPHDERCRRGYGGYGFYGRGPAPEDMPGRERFDPDYDGPMPEGRGCYPSQKHSHRPKNAPVKEPREPDEES